MEEGEARAARRRVLWLMIPVVIVALILGAITFVIFWGVTHPGLGP